MRLLGTKASVAVFRWDLIYLHACILASDNTAITALAPDVEGLLVDLRAQRDDLEDAEDAVVVASAQRKQKDKDVDTWVLKLGGVARAIDKDFYKRTFGQKNPTETCKLALDKQVIENDRIIGELKKLDNDHPWRIEYEAPLIEDLAELRAAMGQAKSTSVALALARSHVVTFKARTDKKRVEIHGKIQAILGSRKEADEFFRPVTTAPDKDEESLPPTESTGAGADKPPE